VARVVEASMISGAAAETYFTSDDVMPVCSVSVTSHGSTVGIWSMATAPDHQGRGFGRALLTAVIETHRARGVDRFFLLASEAGRPLYESLGFETLATCAVWSLASPL
jgi:GNAT superfamily N-acetyltransferase